MGSQARYLSTYTAGLIEVPRGISCHTGAMWPTELSCYGGHRNIGLGIVINHFLAHV